MRFLTNIDLSKNELQNARIQNLATAPANPALGQIYFNTTDKRMYVWNSSAWIDISIIVENAPGNGVLRINGVDQTIYTHPTGDGNLHVPATGTTNNGRVLKAGATAGSVSWGTLTAADVGALSTTGTAAAATKLATARTITLAGVVQGSVSFDGTGNMTLGTNFSTSTQAVLDAKETPDGAQAKATTALNSAKSYTDSKVASLVSSAPAVLDTLQELANALGNDPNFATTIATQLGLKTGKFTTTIGNGTSTEFSIVHNLNTFDVVVSIREIINNMHVMCDVQPESPSTVLLSFSQPPTVNQFKVTIIG